MFDNLINNPFVPSMDLETVRVKVIVFYFERNKTLN